MAEMMIKHEGKMVPAKLVDGKWVPDEGASLRITKEGLERVSGGAQLSEQKDVTHNDESYGESQTSQEGTGEEAGTEEGSDEEV